MAHDHHDPDDSSGGSERDPGAGEGRRPDGPAAGPGRDPGREARGEEAASPGGERPSGAGRPGGEQAPGGDEAAGDGEENGQGGRRARRAWGDAFSEVQDLVGEVVGDVLEGVRGAASARFPRMDLVRLEGEGHRLLVDLPGLTREDVEVLTLGNELTIRGERPRPELPEGSELLRSERAHGRFERTIRMPPGVREEGVAASFEDGVLTVRLPEAEPSDARAVDIG